MQDAHWFLITPEGGKLPYSSRHCSLLYMGPIVLGPRGGLHWMELTKRIPKCATIYLHAWPRNKIAYEYFRVLLQFQSPPISPRIAAAQGAWGILMIWAAYQWTRCWQGKVGHKTTHGPVVIAEWKNVCEKTWLTKVSNKGKHLSSIGEKNVQSTIKFTTRGMHTIVVWYIHTPCEKILYVALELSYGRKH